MAIDPSEPTYAQTRRQAKRTTTGRYANMNRCEGCRKPVGDDYCSDLRVDTELNGLGLVLCGPCCQAMNTLPTDLAKRACVEHNARALAREYKASQKAMKAGK